MRFSINNSKIFGYGCVFAIMLATSDSLSTQDSEGFVAQSKGFWAQGVELVRGYSPVGDHLIAGTPGSLDDASSTSSSSSSQSVIDDVVRDIVQDLIVKLSSSLSAKLANFVEHDAIFNTLDEAILIDPASFCQYIAALLLANPGMLDKEIGQIIFKNLGGEAVFAKKISNEVNKFKNGTLLTKIAGLIGRAIPADYEDRVDELYLTFLDLPVLLQRLILVHIYYGYAEDEVNKILKSSDLLGYISSMHIKRLRIAQDTLAVQNVLTDIFLIVLAAESIAD